MKKVDLLTRFLIPSDQNRMKEPKLIYFSRIKLLKIKHTENTKKIYLGGICLLEITQENNHKKIYFCGMKLLSYKTDRHFKNNITDNKSAVFKLFTKRKTKLLRKIINDLDTIKKQNNELIYQGIFNNLINNIKWIGHKDFIPTLGAANYSFLFILLVTLNIAKPKKILEFGIGQTSKLTCAYAKSNKDSQLTIVEHDKKWIEAMKQQLKPSENVLIANKEMVKVNFNNTENDIYADLTDITRRQKFDFIIIDGPYGYRSKYSRMNILDLIPNNLAKDFIIVLDDVEREGEANTAELIFKKLKSNDIGFEKSYKTGTKSQLIITSKSYGFIHYY